MSIQLPPFLPWLPHKLNSGVLLVMEGSSLCYGTDSCTVRSPQATPVPQCRVGSSRGSENALFCCPPVMGRPVYPSVRVVFSRLTRPSHLSRLSWLCLMHSDPHDYLVCEILSSVCKPKNCDLVIIGTSWPKTHTHTM